MKRICSLLIILMTGLQVTAQNVGIGTTAPAGKLHISTNSSFGSQHLRLEETEADFSRVGFYNSGTAKLWEIAAFSSPANASSRFNIFNSSTGDLLTITGEGNVGIRNTAPQFPLCFANLTGEKISFWNGGTSNYGIGMQDYLLQIHAGNASDDIAFGYGSSASLTETVRFKGNGNVGIGTSTPQFPLSFANTLGDKICFWNGGTSNYGIGMQDYLLQIHSGNPSDDIAFGHGSSAAMTETMRIRGNGTVGIGTPATTAILHVAGNSFTTFPHLKAEETENDFARIGYVNAGTTKYWETAAISSPTDANSTFNIFNSSTGDLFTLKGNGNLGLGTTAPTVRLEVNGFTKLGMDAPAVKVKKFSGTMNATATQVVIPHGMTSSKILAVSVLVEYVSGTVSFVPGGYTVAAGYEYNYHITGTNIVITPSASNSANILSKNFKVMVTYEE